jgi:putative CocE/NonD family hydrolase
LRTDCNRLGARCPQGPNTRESWASSLLFTFWAPRSPCARWSGSTGFDSRTSAGSSQNGGLETAAPGSEPADEYTYDPGNPTPFLVDARELELSLNEDYRTVDTERKDLVTCTTASLEKDIETTGRMTVTLWAATDAKDTDWNVMLQHVYPDGRAERIQDGVMRAVRSQKCVVF